MPRDTFFKHFDLLADQPDAVAKMRELMPVLSANGAAYDSLGQRPRKTAPRPFQALKGRANVSVLDANGKTPHGNWHAPSSLILHPS
jgi:hypothetical protein